MSEPVDTRFRYKRFPVAIVDIGGTGHDACTYRLVLEKLGAVVHFHLPGTPRDFLEILKQGADGPPFLIICAHGDDNGLVFPFDVIVIASERFEETKNLVTGIAYPANKYGKVIYEAA